MALILGVVALLVGAIITISTMPSDDKIEKISFEEMGLDPQLTDNPFVAQVLDTFMRPVQERVRHRVLEEARTSMLLGAGGMLVVTVLGVALITSDSRRRARLDLS
jgi:ABC-type Fe3+ transport system permease subunit